MEEDAVSFPRSIALNKAKEDRIYKMGRAIRNILARAHADFKLWDYLAYRIDVKREILYRYGFLLKSVRDAAFDGMIVGIDKVYKNDLRNKSTVSLPALLDMARAHAFYISNEELEEYEKRFQKAEEVAAKVRPLRNKWVAHYDLDEDFASLRLRTEDPTGDEVGNRVRFLVEEGWHLLQVLAPQSVWFAQVRGEDPSDRLAELLRLADEPGTETLS